MFELDNRSLDEVKNIKKSVVTLDKLNKYFDLTLRAFRLAESNIVESFGDKARDFLLMAMSYFNDAKFFAIDKSDFVLAFGALNYAHAWLDAGARLGFFDVHDSQLFTVD